MKIKNVWIFFAGFWMAAGAIKPPLSAEDFTIASPDSSLQYRLFLKQNSRLACEITFRNAPVIEESDIGISIENTDLCQGVELGKAERYTIHERYPWRVLLFGADLNRLVNSDVIHDLCPPPGVEIDTTTVNRQRGEGMVVELVPGGGFVALFSKEE